MWAVLAAIAGIVAAARPFLRLGDAIQSYEASVARYRTIEGQLQELRSEIRYARAYNEEMRQKFQEIQKTVSRALEEEPYEMVDEELRERLQEQVIRELPEDQFYVPEV